MLKVTPGVLVEYSLSIPPLTLVFDFNPQTIRRQRTITIQGGTAAGMRGGYDFVLPTDTPRVAQGVNMQPESLDLTILLDATDRMNAGDAVASQFGVQPELDTLRMMLAPKSQGPGGMRLLASLGLGGNRAFQRHETPSVLLFIWGSHILPVFLTSVDVSEKSHLPSLVPYRAEVRLALRVIESNNPFYLVEQGRQLLSAALNTAHTIAGVVA